MGESQGEEKGLDRTPCSLANAQRAFWGGGGDLDWRRKKRRKKSDSRQVRKNDSALKRREQYCQKPENSRKKEEYGENSNPLIHKHMPTLHYTKLHTQTHNPLTPLHTPHPLVTWDCRCQERDLPRTQKRHRPRWGEGQA